MAIGSWKDMLSTMESADHYAVEKFCNMSELPNILQTASDNVFTVLFRKKITEESIAKRIADEPAGTFTNDLKSVTFAKSLIEGE
jgi:hypothetical protein